MSREARTIRLTADEVPCIGDVFKHFKGGMYKITHFAWSAEDESQLVIYRPFADLTVTRQLWVRPLREFSDEVEDDNGQWVRRFQKIPKETL